MININSKYVILIWIIILVLFTFYCIVRLKFLSEKYNNIPIATNKNIIDYINNIQKHNKITDVNTPPECKSVYDDNMKVSNLGYNSCQSAYADYLAKGLNFDYNSLADICPVSTKSSLYTRCLTALLNKFTDNANMVTTINNEMTSSINKRLHDRNILLDNVQNQMTPLIVNKDQTNFNNYLNVNNYSEIYKEDRLGLVDNYYKKKYIDIEGFIDISGVTEKIVDPDIEKLFFGNYKPINGQFLIFNDLMFNLGFDTADIPITINMDDINISQKTQSTIPSNNIPIPTVASPKNIVLTVSSKINELDIEYNIINISKFKAMPNAIKLSIASKTVVNKLANSSDSQTIQQLLNTLGFFAPTQLVLSYEEYTSTENILHKTYKLVNDNLDTILVLNRI